ncbi:MAG TPA: spherulation-specific family 4 protein [Gemmataceae bacterium]|nr:spherulation-specific family 4 protein [Gemmataceae bacterium]
MARSLSLWVPVLGALLAPPGPAGAEDAPAARRRQLAQEFHVRAQERTGVLLPLYVYPGEVDENPAYARIMELRRKYETVPMWVVLSPASGPGERADPNYTKAVGRLRGAGCVVLGYVTTGYAKRARADVQRDIDRWHALYPRAYGVFFDEMVYEDTAAGTEYQAALTRYAHDAGFWPAVANPGVPAPARYFAADAADVIVVHEGAAWPTAEQLRGPAGGYADHPPFTRGVLVHSQPGLDRAALRAVREHARWVYVTEAVHRPGDPKAANAWDRVSKHLGEICEQLSQK